MVTKVHAEGLTSHGSFDPNDKLLAGDHPRVERKVVLISGQNLTRGTLLGKITASDKYTLYVAGASDGSEVARAILAMATDASGGDAQTIIYETGIFSEQEVIAQTAGVSSISVALRNQLQDVGIFLEKVVR